MRPARARVSNVLNASAHPAPIGADPPAGRTPAGQTRNPPPLFSTGSESAAPPSHPLIRTLRHTQDSDGPVRRAGGRAGGGKGGETPQPPYDGARHSKENGVDE